MDIDKIISDIDFLNKEEKSFPKNNNKILFEKFKLRSSLLDPLGCILERDGKIYRGVYSKSCETFIELYEKGILQGLARNNVIPNFMMTNYYTDDFPIIFEIEKLQIIPPAFWTYSQIKSEAIFILQLIDLLSHYGYGLVDGHPWNVAFKNGKPVFFDFGSFQKVNSHGAMDEIITYNVITLIMMSLKNCYWARQALMSGVGEYVFPTVNYLLSDEVQNSIKKFTKFSNHKTLNRIFKNKDLRVKDIEKLFDVNRYLSKTLWSNYSDTQPNTQPTDRYLKVLDCIQRYAPNSYTALDMGGNNSLFAHYIKKYTNIKNVICTDNDIMAIEQDRKFEDIDKYLLNPIQPSLPIDITADFFKSDVVTMLAVTHHILLRNQFNIDVMFERLKKYVNKYIFIEFCPLGMYSPECSQLPNVPDYYNLEWFKKHFENYFELLDIQVVKTIEFDGKIYDHRILFIGRV